MAFYNQDFRHLCIFNPIQDGGEWGAAWCPLKMFLATVLKRLGVGSGNLMTFNINQWSIKNSYLGYPMLP